MLDVHMQGGWCQVPSCTEIRGCTEVRAWSGGVDASRAEVLCSEAPMQATSMKNVEAGGCRRGQRAQPHTPRAGGAQEAPTAASLRSRWRADLPGDRDQAAAEVTPHPFPASLLNTYLAL